MTFDPTKPVQTRDGRKARIVSDRLSGGAHKFIAIITHENGCENGYTYDEGGYYYCLSNPCGLDLVNVPEKREMWVNVYEGCDILVRHDSRDSADSNATGNRIACVRVEYEDGEGL